MILASVNLAFAFNLSGEAMASLSQALTHGTPIQKLAEEIPASIKITLGFNTAADMAEFFDVTEEAARRHGSLQYTSDASGTLTEIGAALAQFRDMDLPTRLQGEFVADPTLDRAIKTYLEAQFRPVLH